MSFGCGVVLKVLKNIFVKSLKNNCEKVCENWCKSLNLKK
jgi:hypothetical protein